MASGTSGATGVAVPNLATAAGRGGSGSVKVLPWLDNSVKEPEKKLDGAVSRGVPVRCKYNHCYYLHDSRGYFNGHPYEMRSTAIEQ